MLFSVADNRRRNRKERRYLPRRARVKCQRMTPTETETLSECLVPNCGISRVKSDASTTDWSTPSTSLPKTSAYFYPPESSGEKVSRLTESTVCSTLTTV